MIYLLTPSVDFYGFHVGKYASPMDGYQLSFPTRRAMVQPGSANLGQLVVNNIPRCAGIEYKKNGNYNRFQLGL